MYLASLFRGRYAYQVTSLRNMKYLSETYKNLNIIKTKFDSITLPERFKGTVVEKWTLYWKELYTDYYEVFRETVSNAKNNPKRTIVYLMFSGFLVYCNKTNPTETSYRDALLSASNDLLLVSKQVRNPTSDDHLIFVESCYNAGLIRNFSFGIFSVMWIDDYDSAVALYKANCSYLQPQYLTMYQRIIDVGFLGRWWFIENKMKDYDVNPSEWPSEE